MFGCGEKFILRLVCMLYNYWSNFSWWVCPSWTSLIVLGTGMAGSSGEPPGDQHNQGCLLRTLYGFLQNHFLNSSSVIIEDLLPSQVILGPSVKVSDHLSTTSSIRLHIPTPCSVEKKAKQRNLYSGNLQDQYPIFDVENKALMLEFS